MKLKIQNNKLYLLIFFVTIISVCGIVPANLFAWGSYVHKLINQNAVNDLPQFMIDDGSGNAFKNWAKYLSDHASDPDYAKNDDPNEDARHYINIDKKLSEYPYPFASVPRDKSNYISIFKRDNGVLPWEGWVDTYNLLVTAFKNKNWAEVYYRAAWLGHYVGDSYQPLHVTANYNGQLSEDNRNYGIHSRYETSLMSIYVEKVNTQVGSAGIITDVLEESFTILSESWVISKKILDADLAAQNISGDGVFNNKYYYELWKLVGTDTQTLIDEAAKMLASLWYSAYVKAGSPSFGEDPNLWVLY